MNHSYKNKTMCPPPSSTKTTIGGRGDSFQISDHHVSQYY